MVPCKDDLIYNLWYINILFYFCKIQLKFVFKNKGNWHDIKYLNYLNQYNYIFVMNYKYYYLFNHNLIHAFLMDWEYLFSKIWHWNWLNCWMDSTITINNRIRRKKYKHVSISRFKCIFLKWRYDIMFLNKVILNMCLELEGQVEKINFH